MQKVCSRLIMCVLIVKNLRFVNFDKSSNILILYVLIILHTYKRKHIKELNMLIMLPLYW